MSLEQNTQPVTVEPQTTHQPEFGNLFSVKGAQSADPLAFIRNNLKSPPPSVANNAPQPPTPEPSPVAAEPAPEPELKSGQPSGEGERTPEPQFDLPIEDDESAETAPADSEVDDPAQLNFKNLRTKFKAEKIEHQKTKELLESVTKELEEYREGKKVPETLQTQEEELTRLRRYEKIVNIKTSPEYQEKYVKPLTETATKLKEVFAEYELPEETLSQLRGMKTLAQQNEFISEHFDNVGALQVRNLLDAEKEVVGRMQAAEAEPDAELERLIAEGNRAREVRRKAERESIQAELTSGWQRSLDKIKKDGIFVELIHKANDSAYNQNVVNPILKGASQEASKLIAMLFEDGLSKLRPEVAEYIANMSLLGHSSAINATSRQRAVEYAKTLEKNQERVNLIQRPRIGGSTGVVGAPEKPRETLTPDKVGGAILGKLGLSK